MEIKFYLSIVWLLMIPWMAFARFNVVTTTTDLQAMALAIGKDKIDVITLGKGTQDPHQIEARPSFMAKMHKANLVIAQGLDLEAAWLVPLIQGARNPEINYGTQGLLELGDKLDPIDIPQGAISRAAGDVHPGGNPHFQLDPIRLGKAAMIIGERFGELDAVNREFYQTNALAFQKMMEAKLSEWQKRMEKVGMKEMVTFHKTFSYFCDRFHIKCKLQLEPKPGIPPTTSHLLNVIDEMKKNQIRVVLIENYFNDAAGEKIRTLVPNAKIFRVPVAVGGEPEIKTNAQLIELIVRILEGV